MKKTFLIIGLLTAALAPIKAQNAAEVPVYLDDKQPLELRVQDALKRMTLEEKTRLSYAQGKFSSPGCPRLGIPELWMSDGPHGVRAEINWNERQLYGFSCVDLSGCKLESVFGCSVWKGYRRRSPLP